MTLKQLLLGAATFLLTTLAGAQVLLSGSSVVAAGGSIIALSGGGGGSAPVLLYTDIVSGSATNGEFGDGSYLTLYGENLGSAADMCTSAGAQVTIGGAPIANCRYLVPAVTNGIRPGFAAIDALNVQIGSAAVKALTPGTTYTIGLTVNGVAANTTDVLGNPFNFVIQPGHFYFVDTVNGNDSTGVVDDITHPYRYLQNANGGSTFTGVWATIGPGDSEIIRGNSGTPISDEVGYDNRLLRFHTQGGTAPTGTIGTGYFAFTSYPGPINGNTPEDVYILTPAGGEGGFMGTDSQHARGGSGGTTDGQYWTVSNMRSDCTGSPGSTDASNFNLQNAADFTRFVNLNVQWNSTSTGAAHQKAGGIVGNGYHVAIMGNYVHNISGGDPSSLENHGIYMDGTTSVTDAAWVEIGFNVIINCETGQCIQFHQEGSTGFHDVEVHHNWSEHSAKYVMKMDGWSNAGGPSLWWDNVAIGSVREAFELDGSSDNTGTVRVENNTFMNGYSDTSGPYIAQIANEGANSVGTFTITNNIFVFSPGTSGFVSNFIGSIGGMTATNNLCFDYQGRWTSGTASCGTSKIYADPKFLNNATFPNSDIRLGTSSAAIAAAIAASINPVNDFGLNAQPRAGQTVNSVGAAQ